VLPPFFCPSSRELREMSNLRNKLEIKQIICIFHGYKKLENFKNLKNWKILKKFKNLKNLKNLKILKI
jgi:hypothetical protein